MMVACKATAQADGLVFIKLFWLAFLHRDLLTLQAKSSWLALTTCSVVTDLIFPHFVNRFIHKNKRWTG